MLSLFRSKLFWTLLAGKIILSALFVTTLLPAYAKTTPVPTPMKKAVVMACPAAKTTIFAPAKGLNFPISFTIPPGWSAVWHNRGGACVGRACVASTIELNPGYVYDADRGAIRQGAAIQISLIDKPSFGGGGDEVITKLMERVQVTKSKTILQGTHLLTSYEGKIATLNQQVPSRDYVLLLNEHMLHLSIEQVTPENEQAVQFILNSIKDR
jgi:hypothetical protein